MTKTETRLEKANRLMADFAFVLLFASVSDEDAAKIAVWIKAQLTE